MRAEIDVRVRTKDYLFFVDVGHETKVSATNDAEGVVTFLFRNKLLSEGQRLFYEDSDGRVDEILVERGAFAGFRPGPKGWQPGDRLP